MIRNDKSSLSNADSPPNDMGRSLKAIRIAVTGLFLIAFVGLVYFARDFLLPVVIAFLLALTLSPIVRFLQKHGISPGFSALVLVILIVSGFAAGTFLLSGPVSHWIDSLQRSAKGSNRNLLLFDSGQCSCQSFRTGSDLHGRSFLLTGPEGSHSAARHLVENCGQPFRWAKQQQ